jgi:hypothetical protein
MLIALSWPMASIWIAVALAVAIALWALFRSPSALASVIPPSLLGDDHLQETLEGIQRDLADIKAQIADLQRVLKEVE